MTKRALPADLDPLTAAKDAGLRYMSDDAPGIRRVKKGSGFTYVAPDGKTVTDEDVIKRIHSLVIPPAWTDVWICTSPKGHIQATGRDAKGRKQYRYHPKWNALRNSTKYDKLISFGFALPTIRKQVFAHLRDNALSQQKVLAAVVLLLDVTHMRIGNEEYAKENNSYGLTTLKNRHVKVRGKEIRFTFRGKSGIDHDIRLHDTRLAKIIRQCQELPGHELFQYVDDEGRIVPIDSEHVNTYLREIAKEEFSAKDFRTWGGTIAAAESLLKLGESEDEKRVKECLVCAVKDAALMLGNLPATCRKYYIDPRIMDAYKTRSLITRLEKFLKEKSTDPHDLKPIEKGVHHILRTAATEA